MTQSKPPRSQKPPAREREARLAKALRDNLRRRKAAVKPKPEPDPESDRESSGNG